MRDELMAPPDQRLTLNGADDVQHWRQTLSGQTSILALLHSGSRAPAHTTYTGCVTCPLAESYIEGAARQAGSTCALLSVILFVALSTFLSSSVLFCHVMVDEDEYCVLVVIRAVLALWWLLSKDAGLILRPRVT